MFNYRILFLLFFIMFGSKPLFSQNLVSFFWQGPISATGSDKHYKNDINNILKKVTFSGDYLELVNQSIQGNALKEDNNPAHQFILITYLAALQQVDDLTSTHAAPLEETNTQQKEENKAVLTGKKGPLISYILNKLNASFYENLIKKVDEIANRAFYLESEGVTILQAKLPEIS